MQQQERTVVDIDTVGDDSMMPNSLRELSQEIERQIFFTDVPPGVLKKTEETTATRSTTGGGGGGGNEEEGSVTQSITNLIGSIERALCFTDLQDIDESEKAKIRATLLNVNNFNRKEEQSNRTAVQRPQQREDEMPPSVEHADTDSMSDISSDATEETLRRKAAATATMMAIMKPKNGFFPSRNNNNEAHHNKNKSSSATNSTGRPKKNKETSRLSIIKPKNGFLPSRKPQRDGPPKESSNDNSSFMKTSKANRASKKTVSTIKTTENNKNQGTKRKSWNLLRKSNGNKKQEKASFI